MMRSVSFWFDRLARRKLISVLLPGILIVVLRLLILPWNPVPDPMAPDEFSQLLAAKTFASGRVSNPTPAFPVHFEAPYVLLQPTYASKYPPGPPLLMAIGIVLTGSPWAGVLLGTGLMCSGICWMLQAWVPYRWALAGAMLVVARYSLHHYWLNSYWGGALAAFGGALVLGALPRILRGGTTAPALAMAGGLAILVVTRPYEGMLFAIIPGVAVFLSTIREGRRRATAVLAPMAAVALAAAAPYLWYNWKITGSPVVLPYTAYTKQYEPTPHFIWQSRRHVPPFVHREMQAYLTFPGVIENRRTFRAAASRVLEVTGVAVPPDRRLLAHPKIVINIVFGIALLIAALTVARDRSMRIPLLTLAVVIVGMLPATFFFDHYVAPAVGLMFLIVVQGLRHLAVLRFWRRSVGRVLPAVLSAASIAAILIYAAFFLRFATHAPHYITIDRPRVIAHVSRFPGKHLLLVKFGNSYTIDDGEWIYNEPDLQNARVIWARDMGKEANAEMLRHFRDRQVWYVYKNRGPARLYRAGGVAEPALDTTPPALVGLLRSNE